MTPHTPVHYTLHDDGVAVLTFDRPEARNALTRAAMRQFAEHALALWQEPRLRAVVITGVGADAFCSGGDLRDLAGTENEEEGRALATLMGDALMLLERLPVPVVAGVNGYALGGGSEIALACDIRIVDERAQLGLVHMKLALVPGWGAGQRLLRLVGYARAMDLLLRADALDANALLALGLANQVVAAGTAGEAALAYARQVAAAPRDAVRAVKTLLQAGLHTSYRKAQRAERELFVPLWATDAHAQAVQRFLARDARPAPQEE